MIRSTATTICILNLCAVAIFAGCGQRPITVQNVPVEQSNYKVFRKSEPPAQSSVTRMLVAWFDQPDGTWFFKVSGPQADVDAHADSIVPFLGSVSFDAGQPSWDALPSWTTGPQKMARFATLIIDKPLGLEMAVSRLAAGQDRLANVNRWLTQLNLPVTTSEQLDQWLRQPNDTEYLLFDAVGAGSGQMNGSKSPPLASVGRTPATPVIDSKLPSDITYAVPDGWSAQRVSGMVPGVKFINRDDPSVVITATRMVAAANKWVPNVQRWAGQVDLSLDADQVEAQTEELTIGGVDSQLVKLAGDEQTIIATLTHHREDAWFFKLIAEPKVVEQREQIFRDLIKSVRFK